MTKRKNLEYAPTASLVDWLLSFDHEALHVVDQFRFAQTRWNEASLNENEIYSPINGYG